MNVGGSRKAVFPPDIKIKKKMLTTYKIWTKMQAIIILKI